MSLERYPYCRVCLVEMSISRHATKCVNEISCKCTQNARLASLMSSKSSNINRTHFSPHKVLLMCNIGLCQYHHLVFVGKNSLVSYQISSLVL